MIHAFPTDIETEKYVEDVSLSRNVVCRQVVDLNPRNNLLKVLDKLIDITNEHPKSETLERQEQIQSLVRSAKQTAHELISQLEEQKGSIETFHPPQPLSPVSISPSSSHEQSSPSHSIIYECGATGGTCSFWYCLPVRNQIKFFYVLRARLITESGSEKPLGICWTEIEGKNSASKIKNYKDLIRHEDYITVSKLPKPRAGSTGGGSQTSSCVIRLSGIKKLLTRFAEHEQLALNKELFGYPSLSETLLKVIEWIESAGTIVPEDFKFPWLPIEEFEMQMIPSQIFRLQSVHYNTTVLHDAVELLLSSSHESAENPSRRKSPRVESTCMDEPSIVKRLCR